MELVTHDDVARKITPLTTALERELNPEDREQEYARELRDTRAALRFQPAALAKAEEAGRDQLDTQRAVRAGERVYEVERVAQAIEQHLEPLIVQTEAAPTPAVAFYREKNTIATEDQQLQLSLLDEQRQARFNQEADIMGPAQVLARYTAALKTPHDQLSASVIRWTEGRHGTGWTGRTLTPTEGAATSHLRHAIAAAKRGRRPAELTASIEMVQTAKALAQRAADTRINGRKIEKRVTWAWRDLVA